MENGTETDGVQRQFGHTFITWNIANFCFETSREDFRISTREFCLDGLHATKWKMTLNPKMKNGEHYALLLSLERTGSDAGPAVVFVDSKFLLMNCAGMEGESIRYKSEFEKNSVQDIPLWSIDYVRERLKSEAYKSETIGIWCQIIVDFDDCCRNFEGPVDIGLKTLSENLLKLYETATDHDVVLRVKDKDILAHKAILHSRSTFLAELIATGNAGNLPYLDFKTVQEIVTYFYSGDINYIAKSPSVLMYDCATLLNLLDVKQFYNPQSLEIRSAIDVREHSFIWAIKDFKQLQGDCVTSPLLTSEYIDAGFRITLYTKGIDPTAADYLSVFAHIVQGKIPKHHCIVFSIVNGDKDLWSKSMQLSEGNNNLFGFQQFIKKDDFKIIRKKIIGDTLNISLKIEIHNDSVSSSEKYSISNTAFPVGKYYECLSVYWAFIFQKGLFTDVTVEAGGTSYKANKFILSARSPVFCTLLKEIKDDKLTILDMKSNTLHVILRYMYSGIYEFHKLEEVFEVYRAAIEFSLACLKEKCLDILKENFNAQSVCDALVLSEEHQDVKLKLLALNFIRENKTSIFEDSNWKSLIDKKPSLYTEIMESVNERKDFKEV